MQLAQLPEPRLNMARLLVSMWLHPRFAWQHVSFYTLLISLFFWQSCVLAEPSRLIPVAQRALEQLDATNLDDDWYFTMEVVEGDESQLIHSDPTKGKYEKRELITVNGSVPERQRRAQFRKSEESRIDELNPDATGYTYLVDTATLELIQAGGDVAEFSFLPRVDAMKDSRDLLRGKLLLNLETQQINEIAISNTQKLSPAFSVTLDSYRLVLKFQPEQGAVLLHKIDSQAVGSVGFLKSFENVVSIAFRDYKPATPESSLPD